jgi:hypothetical protein
MYVLFVCGKLATGIAMQLSHPMAEPGIAMQLSHPMAEPGIAMQLSRPMAEPSSIAMQRSSNGRT